MVLVMFGICSISFACSLTSFSVNTRPTACNWYTHFLYQYTGTVRLYEYYSFWVKAPVHNTYVVYVCLDVLYLAAYTPSRLSSVFFISSDDVFVRPVQLPIIV